VSPLLDASEVVATCVHLTTLPTASGLKGNDVHCKSLGLAYSLATSHTSFVAIEERDRATLGTECPSGSIALLPHLKP
jgi:hypothetical protein